jgi:putative GTP pyrophosphokinase
VPGRFGCPLHEVVKIEGEPRVKDLESAVSKVFNRKKYDDPFAKLTDRVGCRLVVMLQSQIEFLKDIVESGLQWTATKDRDYEDEKAKNPTVFTYQSVHYVVRSKGALVIGEHTVPSDTPCEIQLRTLLQHAYSELTHDRVYKESRALPPDVHRVVARSMALIEAADLCFDDVNKRIESLMAEENALQAELERAYYDATRIRAASDKKLFGQIYDALGDLVTRATGASIREFLSKETFVGGRVKLRVENEPLFRQPVVLLLYYLARNDTDDLKEWWPFTQKQLESVFSDLGIGAD